MPAPPPTALVIGATGAFGREVAHQLVADGWRVRALHRRPEEARQATGLAADWVKGDAMERADVARAAEGAKVIVHAANPPGYRNWRGLAVPMLENTIAAATAEGARVLLPGNVYNYGRDARGRIGEDAPQSPTTRKGQIRVSMERRLKEAAQAGAKSLILRAGDFFGAHTHASWMGGVMFRAGRPVRSLFYPGPMRVRHAWAYLPDLGRAAVRLLDMEADLAAVASFHFEGQALTGDELAAAFERVVGRKLPVRPFPWFAAAAVAPFNETLRELLEMRYLWRETVLMDNARLVATLGAEPHTPIDQALRETLAGLGSLDEVPARAA
jgi:nucleoside-diphosphate-sugar epimerase